MASITFAIDDSLKSRLEKFSWVNWSEIAREELIREDVLKEQLEAFRRIISKSKLTGKDALEIGNKIKKSMHAQYKRLYPGAY